MPSHIGRVGRRGGFSLIELLTVLVVIGVLSGLAVLAVHGQRERAELARLQRISYNFRLAQELYRIDNGHPYNGPFTNEASAAAGFRYPLPPDVALTISSDDDSNWAATLALTGSSSGAGTGEAATTGSGPSCEVSLSSGLACGLDRNDRQDLLNGSLGGTVRAQEVPNR